MQRTRDYAIRSYLSKVGELSHSSTCYSSKYYRISYGDYEITVRLSDHFKSSISNYRYNIEIVNIGNNNYVLRLNTIGVTYSVSGTNILKYLKSILLVYPELEYAVNCFYKANKKYSDLLNDRTNKLSQALATINKNKEYSDMVDKVYEENKILRKKASEVNDLRNQLNQLKQNNAALKSKIKAIMKAKSAILSSFDSAEETLE